MEIQAWMFFMFCAVTGVVFLKLGFNALDKTGLSDSISPPIMSLFKHILAISICYSSSYAMIFRALSPIPVPKYCTMVILAVFALLFYRTAGDPFPSNSLFYYLIHLVLLLSHPMLNLYFHRYYMLVVTAFLVPLLYSSGNDSFVWYFFICAWISLSVFVPEPNFVSLFGDKIGLSIFFTIESSLFLANGKIKVFPTFVLFTSFFTSAGWQMISTVVVENNAFSISRKMKKVIKFIEFGVGMAGTILFQNFFRLTSFDHVVAFLYFAVAWLANLALLLASFDFGVFDFLLSNAIVGCTVSQSGLSGATWVAYGAALLLYGLRLKMESLALVRRGGAHVIGFRNCKEE